MNPLEIIIQPTVKPTGIYAFYINKIDITFDIKLKMVAFVPCGEASASHKHPLQEALLV